MESLMGIADELPGRSGAELERLVRKALAFARNEDRDLEVRDLEAQLPDRIQYTAEHQLRLAVHEVGHAVASLALKHSNSAMIEIKRDFNLEAAKFPSGQTVYDLIPDYLTTETSLLNRIAISLSGMTAEQAVFWDRSLGPGEQSAATSSSRSGWRGSL
ncbi:hypothetical protein GOD41_08450 [Sinorhizobium medicae]|nr:hypothetical protein [Sinorhizobium medicae]